MLFGKYSLALSQCFFQVIIIIIIIIINYHRQLTRITIKIANI